MTALRTDRARKQQRVCPVCCNLPHRRRPEGCPGCRKPHQTEQVTVQPKRYESGIAAFGSW